MNALIDQLIDAKELGEKYRAENERLLADVRARMQRAYEAKAARYGLDPDSPQTPALLAFAEPACEALDALALSFRETARERERAGWS